MLPVILVSFIVFMSSLIKMLKEPEFRSLFTLVILTLALYQKLEINMRMFSRLHIIVTNIIDLFVVGH